MLEVALLELNSTSAQQLFFRAFGYMLWVPDSTLSHPFIVMKVSLCFQLRSFLSLPPVCRC